MQHPAPFVVVVPRRRRRRRRPRRSRSARQVLLRRLPKRRSLRQLLKRGGGGNKGQQKAAACVVTGAGGGREEEEMEMVNMRLYLENRCIMEENQRLRNKALALRQENQILLTRLHHRHHGFQVAAAADVHVGDVGSRAGEHPPAHPHQPTTDH